MDYYKRDDCRYCGSNDLEIFCHLGAHAPSNSFIDEDEIKSEKKFPLNLSICKNCFLVQLQDVVSGKIIFSDYHYLSSSSKALVRHFEAMASEITTNFEIKDEDVIVDIGCNDGILLDAYNNRNLKLIGIEPSSVSKIAREKGYKIYNEFFTNKLADNIKNDIGKAKIITATNVFAHVDDMHSLIEGVSNLLIEDGIFIVEVSYLIDLINNNLFDTVYHEHLCYLSLTPLVPFLKRYDLEVFNVQRKEVGASGPSVTFFIKKINSKRKICNSVNEMLNNESKWGVGEIGTYQKFNERINLLKKDTNELILTLRNKGKKIGGFGAPAKGNTLLNFYGLNSEIIEYIADNNTLKQNKYTPSTHIKIVNDEIFVNQKFDYALLLSWNYQDFFLKNSDFIKKGGKFIIPFPKPHIKPN